MVQERSEMPSECERKRTQTVVAVELYVSSSEVSVSEPREPRICSPTYTEIEWISTDGPNRAVANVDAGIASLY